MVRCSTGELCGACRGMVRRSNLALTRHGAAAGARFPQCLLLAWSRHPARHGAVARSPCWQRATARAVELRSSGRTTPPGGKGGIPFVVLRSSPAPTSPPNLYPPQVRAVAPFSDPEFYRPPPKRAPLVGLLGEFLGVTCQIGGGSRFNSLIFLAVQPKRGSHFFLTSCAETWFRQLSSATAALTGFPFTIWTVVMASLGRGDVVVSRTGQYGIVWRVADEQVWFVPVVRAYGHRHRSEVSVQPYWASSGITVRSPVAQCHLLHVKRLVAVSLVGRAPESLLAAVVASVTREAATQQAERRMHFSPRISLAPLWAD